MIKKLTLLLVLFAFGTIAARAQGSTASQPVQLQLNPAIEMSAYRNVNVSGTGQQFHIRANKEFNVSVSARQATNDLSMAIQDNETGGVAAEAYMAYAPVSASGHDLLSNCSYGNDRSFAVNYKANNSSDALLVYTATLP